MHHRALFASFGASSGFSGAALWEWARSPSAASALAFVGSVASTVFAWFLARRQDAARAQLDLDRMRRDEEREQRIADAVAARYIELFKIADDHARSR
jgi:hypothetical protein